MGNKIVPLDVETVTPQVPRPSTSIVTCSCCCCWWYCLVGIFSVLVSALFGFLVFLFSLALLSVVDTPKYDVQNFHIAGLTPAAQSSAVRNSTLVVNVAFEILSRNNNELTNFHYGTLGVQVQADELTIGSGAVAGFRQGQNTKVIPVAFQTAMLVSEDVVSFQNGLDLSDLELAIKVDTKVYFKPKFPDMHFGEKFWLDIHCSALLNTTVSDGAPAVVKKRDCKIMDMHN